MKASSSSLYPSLPPLPAASEEGTPAKAEPIVAIGIPVVADVVPLSHAIPVQSQSAEDGPSPVRRWRGTFCECATYGGCTRHDTCACLAVCCCTPIVVGQLFQRVTGRRCACVVISALLLALTYVWGYGQASLTPFGNVVVPAAAPNLAILAAGLLTCFVRREVRRRDRIPAGECAVAEDAFLSLCCNPCALCQLLRQEQLIGGAYEFCSTTGGPEQRGGGRLVPV